MTTYFTITVIQAWCHKICFSNAWMHHRVPLLHFPQKTTKRIRKVELIILYLTINKERKVELGVVTRTGPER